MTEPRRLLQDANAPAEAAALLRSLAAPTPPSAAKQAELGQQLAALVSPAPAATLAAGTALWIKAAFVIGAIGIAGAVIWALRPAPAPSESSAAVLVPAPVQTALVASAPDSASPAVAAAATPSVDAPSASASASVSVAGVRPKPSPRDHLAEEEALLEQARRLAGGSPAQALSLLQQYQRRFPAGQLSAERMFLSVDVLTRLGKTDAARKQADALIRAFPSSVYAAQVKARSSNP